MIHVGTEILERGLDTRLSHFELAIVTKRRLSLISILGRSLI